ncbi:hypothetical protein MMA231_00938 [Asticcacaulis sp. MM231]|uniref:helix-turn-helix domain-containing protein n=1 Tax=Asticcacaulis sp. MM231 TaxID=3157666 RepID=UPI0032D58C73
MAVTIIQSAVAEIIGGMPVSMAASKYGIALSTLYKHVPQDPQSALARRYASYAARSLESMSKAQAAKATSLKEEIQAESALRRQARQIVLRAKQPLFKANVDKASEALASGFTERQIMMQLTGGAHG